MSEIYRDRTEGAVARRRDLLQRRRDELVTMPHTVRRVVVARRARIAASLAVLAAGAVLIAAAWKPAFAAWIARGLPGSAPAPLTSLLAATWVIAIASYLVARARAEHRFTVAMSTYVLPGEDLDHDLERLSHEHPDAQARAMAHVLEVRSAALPVAAATLVLPATTIYLVAALRRAGWPVISDLEVALAANAKALGFAAAVAIVAGIAMTRRALRVPVAAPLAGGATLAFACTAIGLEAWWLVAPVATALAIAVIAWRLRVERNAIAAEDPAAGSELFTLRGMMQSTRAMLVRLRALLRRVPRRSFVIATPIVALLSIAALTTGKHRAAAIAPAVVKSQEIHVVKATPVQPEAEHQYSVHAEYDKMIVNVEFPESGSVDITLLDSIPAGWHVDLGVDEYTPIAGVSIILPDGTLAHDSDFCDRVPLRVRIVKGQYPQASLAITPKLTLARCH